jgi:glycosyltransferase involved in cell wall biosynthesis
VRLGIEASSIRAGGGLTHLRELLSAVDEEDLPFEHVCVWACSSTLAQLPDRPWLEKRGHRWLDDSLATRFLWLRLVLPGELRQKCDVLFAVGSFYSGNFRPFVTMSQNLLPFDAKESARFGWSPTRLRYRLLRHMQSRTFRSASGIIYLTEAAKDAVETVIGSVAGKTAVIPHGVSNAFRLAPRIQRNVTEYSDEAPFRLIYVSIVNWYKHQWNVVEAVARLRSEGLPLALDLIGPAPLRGPRHRLAQTMNRVDLNRTFVRYLGPVPYAELPGRLRDADAFIFASTCETIGNILIEGMAAGLPIACSERPPMPEVLGDAGVYFDPEDPHSIAHCLKTLIIDKSLRATLSRAAFDCAQTYGWVRCARETFGFIKTVAPGEA